MRTRRRRELSLRQNLRALRRMVAIDMGMAVTYRGEMLLFMLTLIVTPIVSLLVWRAALASGAEFPVDAEYLTTYFVLLCLVVMLTSSWISGHLAQMIRLGELSAWLIRPGSVHLNGLANNVSEKALKFVWLFPMVLILWWVFRASVRIPGDPIRWLLFGLGVILAAVLTYAIDVLVAGFAFWIDDVSGLDRARILLTSVLSGQVVPLALMPDWAQGFIEFQPFRFMVSFPLELLVGELDGRAIALGFAAQLGYVVVTLTCVRLLWRRGLRLYSAVGR